MKLTVFESSRLADRMKDDLICCHGLKSAKRVAKLLLEKVRAVEKRLQDKYPDEYKKEKLPPIPEPKRKRGRPKGAKNKCKS